MKLYKAWFPCLNSMLIYIAACYNFCLKFYSDVVYKNTQKSPNSKGSRDA